MDTEEKLKIVRKNINRNMPVNILIYPFAYHSDKGYDEMIQCLTNENGQVRWRQTALASEDNELFEHIYRLIGSGGEKETAVCYEKYQIGDCMEFIKDPDSFFFSQSNDWMELYDRNEKTGAFRFKNIKLVLFKTEIGFLLLDMEHQNSLNVTQITRINHIMKSTKNSNYTYYYPKEYELLLKEEDLKDQGTEDASGQIKVEYRGQVKYLSASCLDFNIEDKSRPLLHQLYRQGNGNYRLKYKVNYTFEELIDEVLKQVQVTTFFHNTYGISCNTVYPGKAHVFSSILVEKDGWNEKEFHTAFYHLRKGYKSTYQPSEEQLQTNQANGVLHPFANSYWGISREGCANLCHLTEDESTNAFFKSNYADRLDNFLFIYLLALHQYYGLLHITNETAKLSSSVSDFVDHDEEFQRLVSLRDNINFFYLKCFYEEISHITHQAKFYNLMIEELGIRRMMHELHFEMERIIGIIGQIREANENKKNEEIAKNRSRNLMIISIAGALFTLIQTFGAVLEVWTVISDSNTKYQGYELWNSWLTVLATVGAGAVFWGVWRCLVRKK